jgi:hypothetical protein
MKIIPGKAIGHQPLAISHHRQEDYQLGWNAER